MSRTKKAPLELIDPAVEEKCERVLAVAFRGIHHCHPWWGRRRRWGDGVRVEISGASRNYILHPRQGRNGSSWERHPEIAKAVEHVRET